MAKKQRKGRNGVGQGITLKFDSSDGQEAAALAMSQILASKHGRRKDAIVALLASLYEVYQTTGKLLTATEIANAVQGATLTERYASMGFTTAVGLASAPTDMPPDLRRLTAPRAESEPQYVPTELTVSEGKRASAQEVANNFLKAAGSFGFFD